MINHQKHITVLCVVGARPNFMKIAPLIHAMQRDGRFRPLLAHTGQHYDEHLSGIFFKELEIPAPDFHLGIGSFARAEQIERISAGLKPVLLETRPSVVLVVGDVNSTVAAARIARKHRIAVAHVEAGLRSFDNDMPEEHNRVETDRLSDYLFVTEPAGMVNLEIERVPGKRFLVGNVMIDTLVRRMQQAAADDSTSRLVADGKPFVLVTIHRPSNVDRPEALRMTIDLLESIAQRAQVLLPLHPRTAAMLKKHGMQDRLRSIPAITLTDPLGYGQFVGLLAKCAAVVTDSGGVQEEATYLRVPCITMRHNTERPCTVDCGTNVLVGSDKNRLMKALERALAGKFKTGRIPELWDGNAAPRIVAHLWEQLHAA